MIIDELIALLGFKVEGLEKVKAATRAMNPLQKNLKTTASRTALAAGAAGKFKGALAAMGAAILAAGRGLRTLLAGLLRFIGIGAAVGGGLGLIAAGALAMAKNFAKARGEAAQLRREAAALAGQQRTTTSTQSAFDGAIQLQGFSADFAKKVREGLFEKLSEAADQAIRGEGEGKETLKKLGINSAMDGENNQRDTGALALQALGSLLKRQNEAAALRARANALPPGSKERRKAVAAADKVEVPLRKDLDELKLGDEVASVARQLGQAGVTVDQFVESLNKAASLNPGETDAQAARTANLAKKWGEIALASSALETAFGNLKDYLVNGFIDPLSSAMKGLVGFFKERGWIPKTKAEIDAESESNRETNRGLGRLQQSDAFVSEADRQKADLRSSIRMRTDRLNELRQRPNTAANRSKITEAEGAIQSLKDTLKALEGGLSTFGERLNQIQSEVSPQQNIDAMMRDKKTEAGKTEDNRQYSDIGNDKRNISNSVTVNAQGLEGVVSAIKNALSGSALVKSTTASTSAIVAP